MNINNIAVDFWRDTKFWRLLYCWNLFVWNRLDKIYEFICGERGIFDGGDR